MILNAHSLFLLIDFLGVAAAAVGGALEARSSQGYKYDFVGVLGLGLVSALGGGVGRDILIQHGPPLAFTDVRYLICGLLGASLGLLVGARLHAHVRNLFEGQRVGRTDAVVAETCHLIFLHGLNEIDPRVITFDPVVIRSSSYGLLGIHPRCLAD